MTFIDTKATILETLPEYPEHAKMIFIAEKSQAIGEFVDWLQNTKGVELRELVTWERTFDDEPDKVYKVKDWSPCRTPMQKLLADFFKIDLEKVESEKRHMLETIREMNAVKVKANPVQLDVIYELNEADLPGPRFDLEGKEIKPK